MFKAIFWSRWVLRMKERLSLRLLSTAPMLSSTSQTPQTPQPTSRVQLTPEEQKALLQMLLTPLLVSALRKVLESRRDNAATRMYRESLQRLPSVARMGHEAGRMTELERFFINLQAAAKKELPPADPEGNV